MKALVVSALLDDFAGCALGDVATPTPTQTQILVHVHAASLGFPDLLMTHGGYQHKPPLPFVPGMELAGEIVACGDKVTGLAPGDLVVAGGLGAFAEYFCAEATQVRKIPAAMDVTQAAAFGSAYLTAYVSLVRRGCLQAGEWVLVHGAAGGVGLAAVDLAKHMGAKVIATAASDKKLAKIDALYAPDALLHTHQGFRAPVKRLTGGGADVIYDPVGGDVFDESVRCIAWGGRLLVVGFASGRIGNLSVNMPLIKGFSVVGVRAGEFGRRDPKKGAENHAAIWDLAARGKIVPHVHAVLGLSAWREAFAMMRAREIIGRVVLDPRR